jgi:hypothetical protein
MYGGVHATCALVSMSTTTPPPPFSPPERLLQELCESERSALEQACAQLTQQVVFLQDQVDRCHTHHYHPNPATAGTGSCGTLPAHTPAPASPLRPRIESPTHERTVSPMRAALSIGATTPMAPLVPVSVSGASPAKTSAAAMPSTSPGDSETALPLSLATTSNSSSGPSGDSRSESSPGGVTLSTPASAALQSQLGEAQRALDSKSAGKAREGSARSLYFSQPSPFHVSWIPQTSNTGKRKLREPMHWRRRYRYARRDTSCSYRGAVNLLCLTHPPI